MGDFNDILKIAKFLDDARWGADQEFNFAAYAPGSNLEANAQKLDKQTKCRQQILTHYLLYITERQTAYERVWTIGGRVFSMIVKAFAQNGRPTADILKIDGDFVKTVVAKNKKSIGFYENNNNKPFRSRIVTTDYCSIYSTLYILEKLQTEKKIENRDIVEYLALVCRKYNSKQDIMHYLAFALHILTYNVPNKKNTETLNLYLTETCPEVAENNLKFVKVFLNEEPPQLLWNAFINEKRFTSSKRLWCSLRDYIKCKDYNKVFLPAINETLGYNLEKLTYQIELPGDVWNNNNNFIQCNFPKIFPKKKGGKSKSFSQYLRELYEDEKGTNLDGDIANLDVTFDLAQRMCSKKECDYCPFGILYKDKGKAFNKLCVDNPKLLCPIVLYSTGYKMMCKGKENCTLCKSVKP